MSSLYNLEPQPTAKVLIHTTSGDVLLELFAQQTPITSRNFLQHCLDSYYDNTIFHRLVPGFILQGGDPTGTGHGGESSYDGGLPFADEFHSRLKFNRRGLLGMANSGDKDDNGSQFFLTLGKTEELNGRNTMFGRVVGDTIYNLVKMGEAELTEEEGSERPMFPTKVTGTEVLVNPFEDMVRRVKQVRSSAQQSIQSKKKSAAGKKKAGKALLSFGGDEADADSDIPVAAVKKANPKLFDEPDSKSAPPPKRPAPSSSSGRAPKRRASPSPEPVHRSPPPATVSNPNIGNPASNNQRSTESPWPSTSPEPPSRPSNTALLEQTNAQIAALKSSLQRNVPAAASESQRKKSALEAMIPSGSIRGRKKRKPPGGSGADRGTGVPLSSDEQKTLDSFNAFKKRLEDAAAAAEPTAVVGKEQQGGRKTANGSTGPDVDAAEDDEEAKLCDLHFIANCQSCSKWDNEDGTGGRDVELDDDDDDVGWMSHQLSFAKDRLGKDLEWKRQNEQELVVIDPKEREKGFKEERRKERMGKAS